MMLSIAQSLHKLLKVFLPEWKIVYDTFSNPDPNPPSDVFIPIDIQNVFKLRVIVMLDRSMVSPVVVEGKNHGDEEWENLGFFPGYPIKQGDATKVIAGLQEVRIHIHYATNDPPKIRVIIVKYEAP